MKNSLCITGPPEELQQGLFGQTFYYLLQILPHLHAKSIYPQWELRTEHYGDLPEKITVPGVLDLAYTPPAGPYRYITLEEMRRRHAHVLGGDWKALHQLWNAYFRTPERVLKASENVLPPGRILGVHYRGTDKQTATWDSNPISPAEYLTLIQSFLHTREPYHAVFVATDHFPFVQQLEEALKLPVLALGEVDFHMAAKQSTTRAEKADRAMLDCVLLSKCDCVIETSSALPSFAKLLNPDLEIYRCAASKLFGQLYTKMPYFPVAHIPVLPSYDEASERILKATMKDDWTGNAETASYQRPFRATPRWTRNHKVFRAAEDLGLDRFLGKLLPGYR